MSRWRPPAHWSTHLSRKTLFASTSIALIALSPAATAQERPTGFSVGAAMVASTGVYAGQNSRIGIAPVIRYDGNGYAIGTDGARFDLLRGDGPTLSFTLTPRRAPYNQSDAPLLAGLDRETTIDAGLRASFAISPSITASLSAQTEVTGKHNGSEITAAISSRQMLGRFPLALTAGVSWKDANLSNYLYGVGANEVIAGRAAYTVGESITPYLGATMTIPLSDNVAAFGTVRASFLPDTVKNSPIVSGNVAVSTLFGVTYRF